MIAAQVLGAERLGVLPVAIEVGEGGGSGAELDPGGLVRRLETQSASPFFTVSEPELEAKFARALVPVVHWIAEPAPSRTIVAPFRTTSAFGNCNVPVTL